MEEKGVDRRDGRGKYGAVVMDVCHLLQQQRETARESLSRLHRTQHKYAPPGLRYSTLAAKPCVTTAFACLQSANRPAVALRRAVKLLQE